MCGITLAIQLVPLEQGSSSTSHPAASPLDPVIQSLIGSNSARGPDSLSTYTHHFAVPSSPSRNLRLTLSASVLGLRGYGTTAQPLVGKRGVLAWNGQVFDGIEGLEVGVEENDTQKIFDALEAGGDVKDVLQSMEGPFVSPDSTWKELMYRYAFIYLDLQANTLTYQTDPLTRRSLLIYPSTSRPSEAFILSSTRSPLAREAGLELRALLGGEGATIHLDEVRIVQRDEKESFDFEQAWTAGQRLGVRGSTRRREWTRVSPINNALPANPIPPIPPHQVQAFHDHLLASVRRRAENIPPPVPGDARAAVLFSGGVDSTLLAYMLHLCIPADEPIDLINLAFQRAPAGSPDSHSKRAPPREYRGAACRHGAIANETSSVDPEGGLDSAAPPNGLSEEALVQQNGVDVEYRVPDRIGGSEALEELRTVCAGREWRFVEVDVTFEEYQNHRERVMDLMYPCMTEMDLSLAYPLYFASRGVGTVVTPTGRNPYQVRAKVYFSGLGPDEQLAGYSRHRQAFIHGGSQGLIDEIQHELTRLPTRNTSRDDRLLSSHARDARYPYLDLSFIAYLSALPMWEKCDLTMPEGEGDKRLLRLVAERAGLRRSAWRVKRAMQFGSRSAKVGGAGKGPRAGLRAVG